MTFLVTFAIVGGLVYMVYKALRQDQSPHAPASPQIPMPPPLLAAHQERDQLAQRLRELYAEHEALQQDYRTSAAEAKWLRQENERLSAALGEADDPDDGFEEDTEDGLETAAEAEATVVEEPPVDPAIAQAAEAGAAFVAWCNRGGPLVGRYFMFEQALQRTLPDATVAPVYRDRSAAGVIFRDAAADGVEHWLVRIGTTRYLLPQPQSPAQFRELAPAFEGEATPKLVNAVNPARLTAENGVLSLGAPGTIN